MQHSPQTSPLPADFESPADDTIDATVGLARALMPATLDIGDLAHAIRCRLSYDSALRRPAPDVDRIALNCRVVRTDAAGEVRFLVQHGELCRREPSRKGLQSTCTFFRPEKTDLVVYDFISNELRINARTLGELNLYREQFGLHLFGDPEWFVCAQKYTLEPLRADGPRSLECRDLWGIDRVWLTELEYGWPDQALHLTERKKADDLFAALAHRKASLPEDARLLKARFAVKLTGEASPRPLLIQPPNVAEYGRGEEAAPIEQFLRERRFVQIGTEADDETTEPSMAVD
jgi:hypothetical protein